MLADRGRGAPGNVLVRFEDSGVGWRISVADLAPLEEAWLAEADPCCAERMLEHRLALGLPTVFTIARYGLEDVNLRDRTVQLLKESKNVVLSRLSAEDRKSSDMFRNDLL